MATVTVSLPTESNNRIYDTTVTAIAASATGKIFTGFQITWGDAYVGNWDNTTIAGSKINFKISGTTVTSITYTTSSRPTINLTNLNVFVAPNTAVTVDVVRTFNSGLTETQQTWVQIRESPQVTLTYSTISRPTVTQYSQITSAQMQALNYYKTGNNVAPGQWVLAEPFVIGTKNSTISASTYNNA